MNQNPALERAIAYLGRFSRTRKQVEDYLKRKQYTSDQIRDALAYLVEHKYLDDERFAEAYILEKIRNKDGPLKIRHMLFQKGISPEVTTRIINEVYPVELQEEIAIRLMRFKLPAGESAATLGRPGREKLFRFVASRGFSRYVIIRAFKSL